MQGLRVRYRSKLNYSSGFAVFSTWGVKGGYDRDGNKYDELKEVELVALLPLNVFTSIFANGPLLAENLEEKARGVLASWKEENRGVERADRFHTSVAYELGSWRWRDGRREEKSTYTLQLSSFGFTHNATGENAEPELEDLKVFLKLKSTTSGRGPDQSSLDEEGRAYDRLGYGAPLPHFLGLLRSPEFSALTEKVLRYQGLQHEQGGKRKVAGETLFTRLGAAENEDLPAGGQE